MDNLNPIFFLLNPVHFSIKCTKLSLDSLVIHVDLMVGFSDFIKMSTFAKVISLEYKSALPCLRNETHVFKLSECT